LRTLIATVALAAALWFVTFSLNWGNFWLKISLSASTLAAIAWRQQPKRESSTLRFNSGAVIPGLAAALALYLVFRLGKSLATILLPFADHQIGGIYARGTDTPSWLIVGLLLLVTGPAEELYWRGYLQKNLMARLGSWQGWLLGTAIYAGVHVCSLNFMLVAAAAIAGAFWGALYWKLDNLAPVIVSHAVWSAVIFAVFPMA